MLNTHYTGPWSNECYAFTHMCLLGSDRRYREPFLKLRARAYAELARLRLKRALEHPDGQTGKLSPVQIQSVVDPLCFAFGLPPALHEPYHVLAEVCSIPNRRTRGKGVMRNGAKAGTMQSGSKKEVRLPRALSLSYGRAKIVRPFDKLRALGKRTSYKSYQLVASGPR